MIFLTGGARSGKSRMAVEALHTWPGEVTYIATARETDQEMSDRIAAHRRGRPGAWGLIEESEDLLGALHATPGSSAVIIDCLTLWVAALMETRSDAEILSLSDSVSETVALRETPAIVVSNEVGSGVVPTSPMGRRFRDLQGNVNQSWCERAEGSYLVVAGRTLPLARGASLIDR